MCVSTFTTFTIILTASTLVELPGALNLDEFQPSPLLILKDTMRGVAGFASVLQQQTPISDGPTGQIACCHSGLCHGSSTMRFSLSEMSVPLIILCWCFVFCFQVLMWLQFTPMEAYHLGFDH